MALQKVVSSMRYQMQRMMVLSTRRYSNETNINASSFDSEKQDESTRSYSSEANISTSNFNPKNPEEFEQPGMDMEYKLKGAEGINDVFLTGTVFGEVLPTTTGNGVTFLVDIFHNGRYGQYKVRTKVVAFGLALPADGVEVLKEGQKVFVRGRLGSKVERNQDGSSVVRTTHVVGRFITPI